MPNSTKIAIVAALDREVRPLIKNWRAVKYQHDGRAFEFFERDRSVVVFGGIGAEAARRATEAVINLYHPALIQSVGFAGALDPSMKIGNIFIPSSVIDAKDGSRIETVSGTGILLTAPAIAGIAQKLKFAKSYGAKAIDMEASAVARGAQSHGIPFMAVKSISDEHDFEMPPMDRFVSHDGRFHTIGFTTFIVIRPWFWGRAAKLARNSGIASKSLCQWLQRQIQDQDAENLENSDPNLHLTRESSLKPRFKLSD